MRNLLLLQVLLLVILCGNVKAQSPYCTPNYTFGCASGDGLILFQLNTINQAIACNGTPNTWYHDFTSTSTTMQAGIPYTLTVEAGYGGTNVSVWIDLNNNNAFDAGEIVLTNLACPSAYTHYMATITIPFGAPSGNHRLRFRTNWLSGPTDPCFSLTYGNSADFTVNVTGSITVGNGTVSCNYPYTTYWGGGRTQLLYTANQLAAAGVLPGLINKIGFNVYSADPAVMNQFNVRIGTTTSTTLTDWGTSGMQDCYSGTYAVPGTGWQMITLQNPFYYDGTNLIVEICFTNSSYTSYSYVYGTTAPAGQIRPYWMDGITGCSYMGASYTGYTGLPNLGIVEEPGTIVVGSGSVSCNYPYTTYWGGGRTQLLYTADQLAASGASPGIISSIGFNVYSADPGVMNQFNVRIGTTTSTTLTGWVTSGMQTCYSGTYTVPGTGWQMITLQTPFNYDGTNLIIEICYDNGYSYTSYSYVYGTTAPDGQIRPYWMDGSGGCSYQGLSYAGYTGLPNLKIVKQPYAGPLTGTVTSAATGNPVIGAMIMVGTSVGYSTGPNGAYTVNVYPAGTFTPVCSKAGFNDMSAGPFTFTENNAITQNFAMLENVNPPNNVTATLNPGQTAVNINWAAPNGNYELLFDDGIQEDFKVWATAGSYNAVKFTPTGYPCSVNGGKINIGAQENYPEGSNPLVPFQFLVFDASGPGGTPGIQLAGPFDFTPSQYGWNNFTFSTPVTITGGSFYIVQKQGGDSPNAAGVAIDATSDQFRSYMRLMPSGAWENASGNFMMRAMMYGPGGPVPLKFLNPAGELSGAGSDIRNHNGQGMEKMSGSEDPSIGNDRPGNMDNPSVVTGYQVWRLLQGQEGTPSFWVSIGTPAVSPIIDNSWPVLPCNPYLWAVKTQYTGNRWSDAAFSNVIGKCWTSAITVNVGLSCPGASPIGTIVQLRNTVYVDTVYQATLDAAGTVTFPAVWKGTYTLTVIKIGYTRYSQTPVTVLDNMTIDVNLIREKAPPSNLEVNNRNLLATWSPPEYSEQILNETWASNSFATNGWTTSGGTNWQISVGFGNPASSVMFSWDPQVTSYDQYLTSMNLEGLHSPFLTLNYDIYLDNFSLTNLNTMTVELWDGTSWHELKSYTNQGGSIPWTSESLDISAYTDMNFQIRFHAAGADNYSINSWNIDNILVAASETSSSPDPCITGYNFYLNDQLLVFIQDTTYQIPDSLLVYGQSYDACVKAVYGNGESAESCNTFVSHFLCPPVQLALTGDEDAALLSWNKPQCASSDFSCYIYDDGSMENAWAFNPGYIRWLGNKFPVAAQENGILTSFKMLWWNNFAATNQDFQIDVFGMDGVLLGSTQLFQVPIPAPTDYFTVNVYNPISFSGPFYVMLKWNNFSGATHWVGYDQNGPNISQNLAYGYDGTSFTAWTTYAGAAPGIFCLQACGIVSGNQVVLNPAGVAPKTVGQTQVMASEGVLSHPPKGEVPPTPIAGDKSDVPLATGLIGYNIFRSQGGSSGPWNLVKQMVPGEDSLSWHDHNLEPGIWCYRVSAVYDLTAFGFPGQQDESLPDGPQCVTLTYGRPLPFCESWDQGSFGYNNWIFDVPGPGNWTVNSGAGNPAPCADFSWQPARTGYSYSLESPVIDASAWTCAKIWLDFDYKLIDRNMTSAEKLTVEVYYNSSWHRKEEFANNGNVNWTSRHINISAVKGQSFRVRFRVNGANSADIDNWQVDNICVSGICTPPSELAANPNELSTTLNWTAPDCNDTGFTPMNLIFDDGSAENGWGINPGFNSWIGNEFPVSPATQGMIQQVKFYFWNNPSHGSDKLTIDFFNASHTLLGSTGEFTVPNDAWDSITVSDIPFNGMFYAMVHWNNTLAATNWVGYDENGPYTSQNLETYFDGTTWSKLTTAAGANPGVCMIRVKALVNGASRAVELVPGQPASGKANPAGLSEGNRSGDTGDHQIMGYLPVNPTAGSILAGYNVYRTSGEHGIGPFSIINTSVVTEATFTDTYPGTILPGTTFRYFVTDVFNNSFDESFLCESSSDTVTVVIHCPGYSLPFNEEFATTFMPNCWTQTDHQGEGQVWQFGVITGYSPAPALTGNYAYLNSDSYGSGHTQNADLVSPLLDLSGYSVVKLGFSHFFRSFASSSGTVSYSIDNGASWIPIQAFAITTANPETFSQTIAGVAGQSQVRFKWNYTGTFAWYWAVDDIRVTGMLTNRELTNITIGPGTTSCYNAGQTLTLAGGGTSFIVQPGGDVTLIAGQNILFLDGTTVESGGHLWGYITTSGAFCVNPSSPATTPIVTEAESVAETETALFRVYPNPTTGKFTLELNTEPKAVQANVRIYGMLGEEILLENLAGSRKIEFSLSERPNGIYIIRVIMGDRMAAAKIIKQ